MQDFLLDHDDTATGMGGGSVEESHLVVNYMFVCYSKIVTAGNHFII